MFVAKGRITKRTSIGSRAPPESRWRRFGRAPCAASAASRCSRDARPSSFSASGTAARKRSRLDRSARRSFIRGPLRPCWLRARLALLRARGRERVRAPAVAAGSAAAQRRSYCHRLRWAERQFAHSRALRMNRADSSRTGKRLQRSKPYRRTLASECISRMALARQLT